MSGRFACTLGLLLLVGAAAGCRGDRSNEPPRQFFPGMDDQPKYTVQSSNEFFADGRTAQRPVTGTVAFGRTAQADDFRRDDFLRDDDELYRGVDANGAYLEYMPLEKILREGQTMNDLIALGEDRFHIYCMPCHGGTGMGDGMVGSRWSAPLPNWHDPKYMHGSDGDQGRDGYIFHTILNGLPNNAGQLPALRMPAYSSQVSEHDAWAIVAFIRVLQKARHATIQDVPASQAQELERTRPAAPAASTQENTQ
jgi:mono/diheme cytochrome c family protein